MRLSRAIVCLLSTAFGLTAACIPAASQTTVRFTQHAAVTSASPIHVNRCEPVQGMTTVSGYSPGYYPAGRYYWRDAYGHRYYQYPMTATTHTSNPTLDIDYVNTSPKPLREVQFGLVAKGDLVAEVRDFGTFSQGAEIKHSFGLSPNVFPLGTGLA
jgi:hypothetical protein